MANELFFYTLLRDYLHTYLTVQRNFSPKTSEAYRHSINLFRLFLQAVRGIRFDQMDFTCFSRTNTYDFLQWLKTTRSNTPQTLNLRLSAIKSFLKYCGEGYMELMPHYLEINSIHAFKTTKKAGVEYLTPRQLKLVFSLPDTTTRLGKRDQFLMIFAYETGARVQEILNLRLGDIQWGDSYFRIKIRGKGSKIRYVPLLNATVEHLKAYLDFFHKTSDPEAYLFYTKHEGQKTQMQAGTVDYALKKYGRVAIERDESFPQNLHAHMFRHSIAMSMYKKGIPISYIRDFLGHASIETTTIYASSDDETLRNTLEAASLSQQMPLQAGPSRNWKGKEQYLIDYCGLE